MTPDGPARKKAVKKSVGKKPAAKKKATVRKKSVGKKTAAKKKATGKTTTRKKTSRKRRLPPPDPGRVTEILARLAANDPSPECALDHANPFELTAATILSAQCTDERVNLTTPALFARFPDAASMAAASQEDVEELIRSTGFFRNKAKNLRGMAARVTEVYGGEIPRDMDALLTLPGVARKTANVVRGVCWRLADGVVVDTHVGRISRRWGFTAETDPVKVERALIELVPQDQWIDYSHRVIRFGRRICDARKPRCDTCELADLCPRVGVDDAGS